jgi:hypothetical protein
MLEEKYWGTHLLLLLHTGIYDECAVCEFGTHTGLCTDTECIDYYESPPKE